jgi:hypothetical protein
MFQISNWFKVVVISLVFISFWFYLFIEASKHNLNVVKSIENCGKSYSPLAPNYDEVVLDCAQAIKQTYIFRFKLK